MSKIGILGGTFDPIHYAHLFMGQLSSDELKLDKVIYVPNGTPPHKQHVQTPGGIRLEMIKIAIAGNSIFDVSDYELSKPKHCYTIDTIKYFQLQYPTDVIYFIMGEDSLAYVEEWKNAAELLGACEFAVIGRGGFKSGIDAEIDRLHKKYGFAGHYLKAPELDISSDEIRRRMAAGKSVRYLLPDNVIDYAIEHKIYY